MKNYEAEIKLPDSKVRKLMNGGSIRVSHLDLKDHANSLYNLSFHKLKDLNRYVKNMKLMKGFQLNKSHLKDMTDQSGGSILSTLGSIGRVVAPIAVPILTQAALSAMGAGIKKKRERGGNLLRDIGKSSITKALLPSAISAGNSLGKNFGPLNPFSLGMNIGEHVVAPMIDPSLKRGNGIRKRKTLNQKHNHEGGTLLGDIARQTVPILAKAGSDALLNHYGMGVSSYGLGGERLMTNPALNPEDKYARMAHARSFMKRGGSFLPPVGSG